MAIAWTPALAIGVAEIDQQHQELFARAERLVRSVVRAERGEIDELLEFLGQYVVKHFGAEERWMIRAAYPDYARHKSEHGRFIREYERMRLEYQEKGPSALVGIRVNDWIADWLRSHISRSDMELGRYLAAKLSRKELVGP